MTRILKLRISLSVIVFIITSVMLTSCGVYSFTGASIPPEAKTVSVQFFPNRALLIEPVLSPVFTNILRDQFTGQTNLEMVERNGDLAIDGEIVGYKITPVAIQADQTAAQNRLTIVVNARFTNRYEPDKDFETKFTQFFDYSSETDLNDIKSELIEELSLALAQDIFDKAVINW
ncbi:MAG: LptE family protein [Bacteroidota bacterium]